MYAAYLFFKSMQTKVKVTLYNYVGIIYLAYVSLRIFPLIYYCVERLRAGYIYLGIICLTAISVN